MKIEMRGEEIKGNKEVLIFLVQHLLLSILGMVPVQANLSTPMVLLFWDDAVRLEIRQCSHFDETEQSLLGHHVLYNQPGLHSPVLPAALGSVS